LHGRDNRFRPIIILQASLIDIKLVNFPLISSQFILIYNLNIKVNVEEIMEAMTYFLIYVIENLMLPGQIENWNFIIDFNQMGMGDLPLSVLIFLLLSIRLTIK